jgi:hypothetical protein
VAAHQLKRRGPSGFRPTNSFFFIRATVLHLLHRTPVLRHSQFPSASASRISAPPLLAVTHRRGCFLRRNSAGSAPFSSIFTNSPRVIPPFLCGALPLEVPRHRAPPTVIPPADFWFYASKVFRRPSKVGLAGSASFFFSLFFVFFIGAVDLFTPFFLYFFLCLDLHDLSRTSGSCY